MAGGLESISLVQNEHQNNFMAQEDWISKNKPELYYSMIETAEVVLRVIIYLEKNKIYMDYKVSKEWQMLKNLVILDKEIFPLETIKISKKQEYWRNK